MMEEAAHGAHPVSSIWLLRETSASVLSHSKRDFQQLLILIMKITVYVLIK